MPDYLPDPQLLVLVLLFSIARFENQRWIRARRAGLMGSSEMVGVIVELTGIIALLFGVAFLIAYWYDTDIIKVVVLVAASIVVGLAYAALSGMILKRDSLVLWMLGTVAVWPLGFALAAKVTWFGLLP